MAQTKAQGKAAGGADGAAAAAQDGPAPADWAEDRAFRGESGARRNCAHGSFLIRRRRGHPGVVLALVISDSANH